MARYKCNYCGIEFKANDSLWSYEHNCPHCNTKMTFKDRIEDKVDTYKEKEQVYEKIDQYKDDKK